VTLDTILVQDSELRAAVVGDKVVILSIRAGAYFGLNRRGSDIWNMLAAPQRVAQVCDALSQRYEVEREILNREVIAFAQALIERRLLQVVDPGAMR
jgi:hypothetical protein